MGAASSANSASVGFCTPDASIAAQPTSTGTAGADGAPLVAAAAAPAHGLETGGVAEETPLPQGNTATLNAEAPADFPSLDDSGRPIPDDLLTTLDDAPLAGQEAALGNRAPVAIAMAQFTSTLHTEGTVVVSPTTRSKHLDSSKSRSSQLHVSFTIALRFDNDTRSSDIDGGEVAAQSFSALAGAVVGAEPAANCGAVVVPLTPDDVKHRMQQAVPRAARARNNRLRENSSRKQPQRPERHAFRLCGTLVSRDAQGPVPVTSPLPNRHFQRDDP